MIPPKLKRLTEQYEKANPPDFVTHSNYVGHLRKMSNGLNIQCNINIKIPIKNSSILNKKVNLIKLTLKGLEAEYNAIVKDPEYAVVCVSWISVKSYYVLYNLCLILKYLLIGDETAFNSTHSKIRKDFKNYLKNKELAFNVAEFNNLYSCEQILKWKSRSGSNIKFLKVDSAERFQQIIKKLASYSLEEFKRQNKIKNVRRKKDKAEVNGFLKGDTISICEFFYWYRIKANYRDLEYLDKEIEDEKFQEFYCEYYNMTMNFYKAFKEMINKIAVTRIGKEILIF